MNIGYNVLLCNAILESSEDEEESYLRLDATPRKVFDAVNAGIPIILVIYSIQYVFAYMYNISVEHGTYTLIFSDLISSNNLTFVSNAFDDYFILGDSD